MHAKKGEKLGRRASKGSENEVAKKRKMTRNRQTGSLRPAPFPNPVRWSPSAHLFLGRHQALSDGVDRVEGKQLEDAGRCASEDERRRRFFSGSSNVRGHGELCVNLEVV